MLNTPAIVGALFALFCVWMLKYAISNLREAEKSKQWPSVPGRLTKVELWGMRNVDGEMKPVEKLSVDYQYDVNGQNHQGRRVAFYTLVYPETVAFANAYPEGSEVSVFYQPADPTQSVLVPGVKAGNKRYSEIIIASVALMVAVAVSVAGYMGVIG